MVPARRVSLTRTCRRETLVHYTMLAMNLVAREGDVPCMSGGYLRLSLGAGSSGPALVGMRPARDRNSCIMSEKPDVTVEERSFSSPVCDATSSERVRWFSSIVCIRFVSASTVVLEVSTLPSFCLGVAFWLPASLLFLAGPLGLGLLDGRLFLDKDNPSAVILGKDLQFRGFSVCIHSPYVCAIRACEHALRKDNPPDRCE